jgi:hypothetical protein
MATEATGEQSENNNNGNTESTLQVNAQKKPRVEMAGVPKTPSQVNFLRIYEILRKILF